MKLQYKAALAMFISGTAILLITLVLYDTISHHTAVRDTLTGNERLSVEVAQRIETILQEKAAIASTLASAPVIEQMLEQSNIGLSALSSEVRQQEIDGLNQKWRATKDIHSPFIQSYMTNPVAAFLKRHQELFPRDYGEIFLTNRYGAIIATTGKLTTLAHSHKYWWIASYDDGKGRIFFDDRGFDSSVEGYVLGVVVPIKKQGEVIGILKCNINIMGPLRHVIDAFCLNEDQVVLKIVRSGGLIVLEKDTEPLSTTVPDSLVTDLQQKQTGSKVIRDNEIEHLAAYSPIPITMGSETYGFGGNYESIDHIKGNLGEVWYTVIYRLKANVIKTVHETTMNLIFVGITFILALAFISFLLGRKFAKPIETFANAAKTLGAGNLDTKITISSRDEIGDLAHSFNAMTDNLRDTMASRDELAHEIDLKVKAEQEKNKLIVELKTALSEVKTLQGIIPICSKCHKIRDDEGYWQQVDQYISQHSEAQFSHGMCEKCCDELYGGQDWYDVERDTILGKEK